MVRQFGDLTTSAYRMHVVMWSSIKMRSDLTPAAIRWDPEAAYIVFCQLAQGYRVECSLVTIGAGVDCPIDSPWLSAGVSAMGAMKRHANIKTYSAHRVPSIASAPWMKREIHTQ